MLNTQCLDAIFTRTSIRRFKLTPIPDEVIIKILEAGTRAPTASGGEQWFFMVIADEETRKSVHRLLRRAHEIYARDSLLEPYSEDSIVKWMKRIDEGMYYAPLYIAAFLDLRKRIHRDEYLQYERVLAIQSLSAALQNMIISAWLLGVGSVWLGVPLLLKEEFDRLLNPPQGCELQAVIAFGYPSEEPRLRKRKNINEVVVFKHGQELHRA
ncbi:MAG: nitroreductase family protein [Candidatus Nezhaarchaeales archaeon]